VGVAGVRPCRKSGDDVDLAKELADQLARILLRGQLVELSDDARERRFDVGDGSE
jgi:hypothetical protein